VTAVSLSGVSKIFNPGRPDEVTALSGIDLTVGDGRFVSLIGPSGCGKSTLLRLIADLIPATAGTVEVAGKSATQARLDQEYGIAFQQAGLFEWRTVQRNVELPLELRGASRAARRDRALEMLALVGLADFAGHYPAQLSGGMQQRVAIARALAVHPPLLLMDEPFGALDEMTRERLQTELLAICAQTGTSTVFVTHSISEAVFLSDRVVVMSPRPGRITATIDVDLPARDDAARQSPAYFEAITSVRRALRGVDRLRDDAAVAAPSPRTPGPASSAATAP
jgi:NitT/TauT family transport system ATP-binding protein